MNTGRRMNKGLFGSFYKLNKLFKKKFPYSGYIEDTKSVDFASVAICLTFFHKMTGLSWLFKNKQVRVL